MKATKMSTSLTIVCLVGAIALLANAKTYEAAGLIVIAGLIIVYKNFFLKTEDLVMMASSETKQIVDVAAKHIHTLKEETMSQIKTEIRDILANVPALAEKSGKAFAKGLDESIPLYTISESFSRNKIGLAATTKSIYSATSNVEILCEGIKAFSMLGLEANCINKFKAFAARPNSWKGDREEAITDAIPVAILGASIAGFEVGDVPISTLMDRTARNITNADKVTEKVTLLLKQAGLISDPNLEALTRLATEADALKDEWVWITNTLASNANDFCKQQESSRVMLFRERINKLGDELTLLGQVNVKLRTTHIWQQTNFMVQKSYDTLGQIDTIQKQAKSRIVPAGVCIYGEESQIGKSELAERLIQLVQIKLMERDDHHFSRVGQWGIWRPQVRDEFDTGYCGQEVTYQDDAFNGKDNLDHPKWINFISPSPVGTVQAQLAQKGCPYRSVLAMVSCNQLPVTSVTITNIHALHERFPITIRARTVDAVPKTENIEKEFKHLKLEMSTMKNWVSGNPFIESHAKVVTVDEIAEAIVKELLRREAFYEAKLREEALSRYGRQEADNEKAECSSSFKLSADEKSYLENPSEDQLEKIGDWILEQEEENRVSKFINASKNHLLAAAGKTSAAYQKIQGGIEEWHAKRQKVAPRPDLKSMTEEEVEELVLEVEHAMKAETEKKVENRWARWKLSGKSFSRQSKPRFIPVSTNKLPGEVRFSTEDQLMLGKMSNTWAERLIGDLQNAVGSTPVEEISQLEMWWKYLEMDGRRLTEDIHQMSVGQLLLMLPKFNVISGKEVEFTKLWAKQIIVKFSIKDHSYFWGPRLFNGSRIFLDTENTRKLIAKVTSYEITIDEWALSMERYLKITGTIAALTIFFINPFLGTIPLTMAMVALLRSPKYQWLPCRDIRGKLDFSNVAENIVDLPMRLTSTVLSGLVSGISTSLSLIANTMVNAFISILQWFGYHFDVTMESWLHSLGRKVIDVLAIGVLSLLLLLLFKLYRANSAEVVQEESGRAGNTRQGKVISRKGKVMRVRQEAENRETNDTMGRTGSVECEAVEIGDELLTAAEEVESIRPKSSREHHITFYWSKHYGWARDEPNLTEDYNKLLWDGHDSEVTPRDRGYPDTIKENNGCKISSKTHFRTSGARGRSLVVEIEVSGTSDEVTDFIQSRFAIIRKTLKFADLSGIWESCTWKDEADEDIWVVRVYCYSSLGVKEGEQQETYWTRAMLRGISEVQRELNGIVTTVTPKQVIDGVEESLRDIPAVGRIQRFLINGSVRQWGLAHRDLIAANGHFGNLDDLVQVRLSPNDPMYTLGIVVSKHKERDLMWIQLLKSEEAAKRLVGRKELEYLDIQGYSSMQAPDLTSRLASTELLEKSNGCTAVVKLPTTGITAHGKLELVGQRTYNLETGCVNREWFHITGFSMDADDKLTQKGDCGGPVFLRNKKHDCCIIGMHAGSGDAKLYGTILTTSDLPELGQEQSGDDVFEDLICNGPPEHMPPGGAVTFVGRYNGENLPMSGTKSPWKKSPWSKEFEEVLVPPPLLATDSRIEAELPKNLNGTSNLVMNQTKFLAEVLPEMDQKILDYVEDAKVEELVSLITINKTATDRDDLLSDGLNGHFNNQCVKSLNIDASAGLPWTDYPGLIRKADHIKRSPEGHLYFSQGSKAKQRINCILDRAREGKRSIVLVGAKLKDQLIKLEHVKKGKVRVYHCVPIEKIVADAALFGHFKEGFLKLGLKAQHAIGVNPHSMQWTAIADHLQNHPNYFDLDFSQYDKRLHAQVMRTAFNIIRRVIQIKAPDDWDEARRVLGEMSIETLVVDYNTIYKTTRGNKSGEYLTTVINSIVNDIYSFYCWVKLTKRKDFYQFRVNVRTVSFGDDKIESVSDNFYKEYNYQNCEKVLAEIGHVITPGGKTGMSNVSSIEDLEFLKRRFAINGRWYFGPLKKTSIENPFVWTAIPEYEFEIWYGLVAENLYEASLWGSDYYYEFRNKLRRGVNRRLVEHLSPLLNRKFEEVERAYQLRYVTGEYGIRDYEQFE